MKNTTSNTTTTANTTNTTASNTTGMSVKQMVAALRSTCVDLAIEYVSAKMVKAALTEIKTTRKSEADKAVAAYNVSKSICIILGQEMPKAETALVERAKMALTIATEMEKGISVPSDPESSEEFSKWKRIGAIPDVLTVVSYTSVNLLPEVIAAANGMKAWLNLVTGKTLRDGQPEIKGLEVMARKFAEGRPDADEQDLVAYIWKIACGNMAAALKAQSVVVPSGLAELTTALFFFDAVHTIEEHKEEIAKAKAEAEEAKNAADAAAAKAAADAKEAKRLEMEAVIARNIALTSSPTVEEIKEEVVKTEVAAEQPKVKPSKNKNTAASRKAAAAANDGGK